MQKIEPLLPGKYYHIFNRGIDSCNLFQVPENYEYFLGLYDQYISPMADTFAWVLMPNHFHFLVRIKVKNEIGSKPPHQNFSNLFNAYSKAINKRFLRHGSLFERPFKRKLIDNKEYLKQVILYIHNNPLHHGFCDHPVGYPWSSYLTCISLKPTKLHRETVVGWFDDVANFKFVHDQKIEVKRIEEWLNF
jgi:putative transposase